MRHRKVMVRRKESVCGGEGGRVFNGPGSRQIQGRRTDRLWDFQFFLDWILVCIHIFLPSTLDGWGLRNSSTRGILL